MFYLRSKHQVYDLIFADTLLLFTVLQVIATDSSKGKTEFSTFFFFFLLIQY